MYKQGDIIMVRYPLSDKLNKSIIRPAVVVSGALSNRMDHDVLVCQITTQLRDTEFSILLTDNSVTVLMPKTCEVRCNKIATIRVNDKLIIGKVSEMKPGSLKYILDKVKQVFDYE